MAVFEKGGKTDNHGETPLVMIHEREQFNTSNIELRSFVAWESSLGHSDERPALLTLLCDTTIRVRDAKQRVKTRLRQKSE